MHWKVYRPASEWTERVMNVINGNLSEDPLLESVVRVEKTVILALTLLSAKLRLSNASVCHVCKCV